MDPCSFVRIIIGNLAVRFPGSPSTSSSSGPSVSDEFSGNCYCKIKLKSFPRQIVSVPVLLRTEVDSESESWCCSGNVSTVAACFSLSKSQIETSLKKPKWSVLSVEVYSHGAASCGLIAASGEKLIGRFEVSLDLKAAETKTCLAHNGWVDLGTKSNKKMKKKSGSDPELHVSVRVEPDPRFVFQFDGEPECSPELLSVSRDRHFSVSSIRRTDNGEVSHKLMAKVEAHKRTIWACSWNPFGHQFATSSRDKTVKIWSIENEAHIKQILALPQFGSSVTAVAWTGLDRKEKSGCVAVGMESGLIELWNIKIIETEEGTTATASLALWLEPFMCHVSAVNRLAWRPTC